MIGCKWGLELNMELQGYVNLDLIDDIHISNGVQIVIYTLYGITLSWVLDYRKICLFMLQKLKCYLSHIVIIKAIKKNKLNMLQLLKLTKRRLGYNFSWMNWVRSKRIASYTMRVIMLVMCVYILYEKC